MFPRGRLALLWPLAAALLIAGVGLTGLGAQGRGIADLLNAPFITARATTTRAPTATAVTTPIVGTPTPQIRYAHDRMHDRNAALGCADGKPPALTKPVYTSKGFASGVSAPNQVALTFDDGPTPYTTPPILDYLQKNPEHIAATVLSEAHPGAVILMHDGPARREQTLAALPIILAGLKARGLKPVTLPQLLMDSQYPGVDTTRPSWRDKPDIPVV